MFWGLVFLSMLLVSAPPGACSCETVSSRSYQLGPADADFGAMQILQTGPEQYVLLTRPIGAERNLAYISSDGERWHRAPRRQQIAMSHLVVASGVGRGKSLYRLLADDSVLERSTDSGRNWVRAKLLFPGKEDKPQQIRLTIVGINGLALFARIGTKEPSGPQNTPWPGVYFSRDGGDEWQLFANDLVVGTTVPELGGTVFAVNRTGLVESKDNGHTWSSAENAQRLPTALRLQDAQDVPPSRRQTNLEIYQIEFLQLDPRSAFLVTNGGLFITHDNGRNWCLVTFDSDMLYTVLSVAIANQSGSHVLATTADRLGPKLWESKDGGESFRPVAIKTSTD